VAVSGDFEGLAALKRAMAEIGTPAHRLVLAKNLAEEARTQVVFGFQRSVDPYDQAWKPLRSRQGQPLRDTGRLQNSVAGQPHVTANGFTISTGVKYAATHQYGATIVAKNATMRFGGAGSAGQDTVTSGKPMLRFRVGGRGKKGRWVSKEKVTIPRRQFMPEGVAGRRWTEALEKVADLVIRSLLGVDPSLRPHRRP
jgi:phage gpG-like protein